MDTLLRLKLQQIEELQKEYEKLKLVPPPSSLQTKLDSADMMIAFLEKQIKELKEKK